MTSRPRCVEDALQIRALSDHATRRQAELAADGAPPQASSRLLRVGYVVFVIETLAAVVVGLLLCLHR